jgi:hypothetical protein
VEQHTAAADLGRPPDRGWQLGPIHPDASGADPASLVESAPAIPVRLSTRPAVVAPGRAGAPRPRRRAGSSVKSVMSVIYNYRKPS